MQTLISLFASVLGLPESEIVPTMSKENTPEWDSLNSIVLLIEIEKKFGVKFTPGEEARVNNFADVVESIRAKGRTI